MTATDNPNLDKIKSVAALHNHTERNIQLYHKKYLGYSAKEINRYERFLNAVKFIQHNITLKNKVDWFEIVDKCGYYDQSQLIRDFKYYIDLSPTKYLEFQQAICNPKS
ncbi:AraC family transcriptional regulator [Chryseobacterium arachidis]|uniref:AraC family transcriptional regulator n=1 Tax=Chryseobacterium arachidis TaxID=1416778 RepID=UPI00361ABF7B